jgi:NADH:ubiquinone oxidoreductase subunit 6 (subunit J)
MIAGVAGLFFVLNAQLLAAAEILVAGGGTVMLIFVGTSMTGGDAMRLPRRGELLRAAIIGGLLTGIVIGIVLGTNWAISTDGSQPTTIQPNKPTAIQPITIDTLGRALVDANNGYLIPLELVSIVILVIMIGTAYLIRPRRKAAPAPVRPLAHSPHSPSGGVVR